MTKHGIDKAEICKYFRERHISEMQKFLDFSEKMQRKGMVEGCVVVKFADGTVEQYNVYPDEQDEVLAFCQQLCSKRAQKCISKQEEFKD